MSFETAFASGLSGLFRCPENHDSYHKTNTKDCLVSPSTPKAFHHNPRSTAYASSQRSKPTTHSGTPTLSTRDSPSDTHTSRDQNDNFEDDDEDTILLGGDEDENVKKNDNQFDFLLNW